MAGFEGNTENEPTSGLGSEQRGPDFAYDRDSIGDAERNAAGGGGTAEKDEAGAVQNQSNDLNYSPGDGADKKGKKRGGIFARRGGLIGIVLTGVGLISATFLGSSALPFSILGNMNEKSILHGLQQYADDYYGFTIFGKTNKSTVKVSATGDKLKGLRDTEVTQLKAKGVEFEPADGTKTKTGRYVFDKVRMKGGSWVDASNFSEAMRDSSFRAAMRFEKGSLWKSAKSQAFAVVKNMFKLNSNPDLKGDTPEDSAKKLVAEATDDVASNIDPPTTDEKNDPNGTVEQNGRAVAGELSSQIDAEKASIAAGTADRSALGVDIDMSNPGYQLSKAGVDIQEVTTGLGGKIWSYVNSLDILSTVCTIYQTAYTANLVARTIVVYNFVKLGMTVITAIERNQAGEDNDNTMSNLMALLTTNDPNTGRSFTSSSYASYLFSGVLSSEPAAASLFGGSAMVMLYTAMHALHAGVGQLTTVGLGGASSARYGRAFLKNACGAATNLGVQIGATAVSLVAAVFTGGGSAVATTTASRLAATGLSAGVKQVGKELAEKFGKEAIQKIIKEKGAEFAEKGILKTMAKDSWLAAKKLFNGMSIWDKLGFLMAGVSTFGLGYIVHALSGATVAGATSNGVVMMDTLGLARQNVDFMTGLGAGGSVATYAQSSAYSSTRLAYENAYVEDMQYAAKSTPFDIKNPYSATGRVAYSIQKTIGIPTSTDPLSTLAAIATLPFKLPNATTASAASDTMTPEAVGEYIGNEFYMNNQISQMVTGVPELVFEKNYTFSDVLAKLVDSENPQMSFDGFDSETNEPKLSVIPGSDLAAYVDKCKNPARTELDPEFENEEASNLYDIDTCVKGRPNYKSDVYPLYDDALRFANQVNPSAAQTAQSAAPTDKCPAGSTVATSITQGYWSGKYQNAVFCAIDNTSDSSLSGIRDADLFRENNEILQTNDTGQVVVKQDVAQDMVDLVKAYGGKFSVTFSYRSHAQQCLMYFYDHKLSTLPVECRGGKLTDSLATSLSSKMSGNYTMPGSFYESRHESGQGFDAIDLAWVERCVSQNLDGNDTKYKSGSCFNFVPQHIKDDEAHVAWEGGD